MAVLEQSGEDVVERLVFALQCRKRRVNVVIDPDTLAYTYLYTAVYTRRFGRSETCSSTQFEIGAGVDEEPPCSGRKTQ
jgi:hypothetical protein